MTLFVCRDLVRGFWVVGILEALVREIRRNEMFTGVSCRPSRPPSGV